jgi:purine nucleoside phosphorylase
LDLAKAKIFDFTGASGNGSSYKEYDAKVAETLRQPGDNKLAIVLDYGWGFKNNAPHLVLDHLNLSGSNPLRGPNNPIGERFPVVNGIYVTDCDLKAFQDLKTGVVAGLRQGQKASASELAFLYSMGAGFYSYNLVPTMLVAAHAGWRVLAVVGPDDAQSTTGSADWRKQVLQSVSSK